MEVQELVLQKELNTRLRNKMEDKTTKEIMKKKVEEVIKEKAPEKESIKKEQEIEPEKKEPEDVKKPGIKKEKLKKTEAIVRAENIPISTKESSEICRFIKGKKISEALRNLEEVVALKRAVPMRGEHPHRKGKIMSGAYPKKTANNFIILLKSLAANASDLNEPVISEAFANIGSRPYGKFGRVRKKRTHVFIKVIEKKEEKIKNGRKKNS